MDKAALVLSLATIACGVGLELTSLRQDHAGDCSGTPRSMSGAEILATDDHGARLHPSFPRAERELWLS
jgi:hypothetical protein